jgi:hypothetical protein
MKMISMKRTPEDKREDAGAHAPMEAMAPDYPYGLCIHMDKDELDKLGITDLPKVGTEMTMTVKVCVSMVSQSAATGKEAYEQTSVNFQITDMALE